MTCVTKRPPSTDEWIGGLRFAGAFITPVALGEAVGHTLTGLFIGIGAFMVANADLGESYPQRLRLMVPTTLVVAAAASTGFVVGTTEWLVVAIGVAVFFVGGLSSDVGREASMLGTLVSFAYVVVVPLAGIRAGAARKGGPYHDYLRTCRTRLWPRRWGREGASGGEHGPANHAPDAAPGPACHMRSIMCGRWQ